MVIGVTDSGIGGLNLLASLMKSHIAEEYIYFADNANLPYGDKSKAELTQFATSTCRKLADMGASAVVFGCNTLSVVTLDSIRKNITTPVFGIIPPLHLTFGETLVLSTDATALHLPPVPPLCHVLPSRDLAALVEDNYPDTTAATNYILPYLSAYHNLDCLVLGCSHFIYLKKQLCDILHPKKVFDGTENTASIIKAVLGKSNQKIRGKISANEKPTDRCKVRFIFSGKDKTARYADLLNSLIDR